MSDRTFAAVPTRDATSLSRRTSLLGLVGAITGLRSSSSATSARSRNTKRKKNANKPCQKQERRCVEPVTAMCVRNGIPLAICEEEFLPCCRFFSTCAAAQALACLHFTP